MDINVREQVRTFVAERLLENRSQGTFGDSDSLFLSGRLSSFYAVELIMFVESEFGVDLADADFDQTRLDTIDSIVGLIDAYGGQGAKSGTRRGWFRPR